MNVLQFFAGLFKKDTQSLASAPNVQKRSVAPLDAFDGADLSHEIYQPTSPKQPRAKGGRSASVNKKLSWHARKQNGNSSKRSAIKQRQGKKRRRRAV